MKKILLIILLFAGVSFSQVDTVKVPGSRYNSADSIKIALDRGFTSVQTSDSVTGYVTVNDFTVGLATKQNAMGSNDNYVSDAQLVIIGNTLGTNTGDNATNSQYSGLAASKQNTLVSGSNIRTVNGNTLLGSTDLVITATLDTPKVKDIIHIYLADSAYSSIYTGTETDSLLTLAGTAGALLPTAGTNPTTNATGEISVDTDDNFIEFYNGTSSRVIPNIQIANYTILYPDTIQARSDDVILAHFPAEIYPHGVTITYVCISASASATDTHVLEEWSDAIGTSQGTVESLALSTSTKIESTSIDDSSIAADAYLNINLDGTPDNINWIQITIGYYANPGD